jgi:hypothetical protein
MHLEFGDNLPQWHAMTAKFHQRVADPIQQ